MSEESHRTHRSHKKHHRSRNKKISRNALLGIVLGSVAAFLLLVYLIFMANSFPLALRFVGMDPNSVHVFAQNCYDVEGREFRVVQADSATGNPGLAIVSKNDWGFWSVIEYRISNSGLEPHFTSLSWVQPGGVKTFAHDADSTFEHEWHFAYCGDNAETMVELKPEQIPHNVTVNIQQSGKTYWIHVISFADEETVRSFDVKAALIENGCIPEA